MYSHQAILEERILKLPEKPENFMIIFTYIHDKRKFYVLNNSIDLTRLHDTAKQILELFKYDDKGIFTPDGTPTGLEFN